ncbi:MAG: hypothetical protein ACK4V1_06280 [Burkholderiaceae bacterium]
MNALDPASFWPVFAAVALLIGIAVAAMALGVIFRRPCLRGSCGGPKVVGPDGEPISCTACPNRKRAA